MTGNMFNCPCDAADAGRCNYRREKFGRPIRIASRPYAGIEQLHLRNELLGQQIQALRLTESCTLVGHAGDVRPSHHAFDLFVQSSDYEGTPNAVLEAMALETPIVATDAGGTAELVEDGVHGRILPIGRVDRLIHAMQEALADSNAARKMADRARLRVEGELSFESRVRKVEGIYAEMMGHA